MRFFLSTREFPVGNNVMESKATDGKRKKHKRMKRKEKERRELEETL